MTPTELLILDAEERAALVELRELVVSVFRSPRLLAAVTAGHLGRSPDDGELGNARWRWSGMVEELSGLSALEEPEPAS